MIQFQGFKPDAMKRIAGVLGYQGNMNEFESYLNDNPDKKGSMDLYKTKAIEMARGGVVRGYATGGVVQAPGMENIPGTLSYEQALGRQMSRDVKQPWEAKRIAAALALGPGTRYTIPPENMAEMEQAFASQMSQGQMSSQLISSGPQRPLPADFRIFKGGPKGPGTEQGDYFQRLRGGDLVSQMNNAPQQAPQGNPSTGMINISTGMLAGQQPPQVIQQGDPRIPMSFEEYKNSQPIGPAVGFRLPSDEILRPRYEKYADFVRSGAPETTGRPDPNQPPSRWPGDDQGVPNPVSGEVRPPRLEDAIMVAGPGLLPPDKPNYFIGLPPSSGPGDAMPPATNMPQFPENTLPYNPTPPPGGYPKMGGDSQATAPPAGPVDYTQGPVPQSTGYQGQNIGDYTSERAFTPAMPYGATVQPVGTAFNANQAIDTTSGQVAGDITAPTAGAVTAGAVLPTIGTASKSTATTVASGVDTALNTLNAAQGTVDPRSVVTAQATTNTGVSNLNAVQGTGILMANPTQRKIETGELVSGAANAETAAAFTEQVQAAEATPSNKATVQGQLEGLMQSFEGGNTPAWAAGALRNVSAQMAARGLGASSMAAQALVQGALESALPIAQADAQIFTQFETQNLSNRQQRAMLSAQQRATFMGMEFDQAFQSRVQNSARIGDIANMNFTAEQQVNLENSRIANTVNLANLSNGQAMVMAEAAALSQLDMANLSNRQQSAVLNAQSFMQIDMANLSNQQQTDMFKGQQRIQSLFTDQAAINAASQFNATSENQTEQFFASLRNSTSQFNAAQTNAQSQFNAGQTNSMSQFTANIKNQRDQFNANNKLVIDQNNATWRRQIATADTAAVNRANELNAINLLEMSNTAYNNLWTYYDDSMEWAWTSVEKERDRQNKLAERQLINDGNYDTAELAGDQQAAIGFGDLIGNFFTGGSGILSGFSKAAGT